MKVHVAINLLHCRGHFRKKLLMEEAPDKLTWNTQAQTEAPDLTLLENKQTKPTGISPVSCKVRMRATSIWNF